MTPRLPTSLSATVLTQDRQRIPTLALYLLLGVAVLPLSLAAIRLLAQTSMQPGGLLVLGEWLNHELQLSWISYNDRDVALYILLLPMAAFMTALTRLTLGIRVLGFRAILISIAFQEIGILPCLLLILIIAVIVVLVRPLMRRSGLPLFARIAVILCIVALTMVMGLLSGAWFDSPTLWSMAFFPVVILAMLAESIAKTVARESILVAVWRTGTTIVLALLIAGISHITWVQQLHLNCPELLVTILVLTIFVAEFMDFRLLESFRPGVRKKDTATASRTQVVLLRNRFPEVPIQRSVYAPPRRYRRAALQSLIDQLRQRNFDVTVLEVDSNLPAALSTIAKKCSATKHPGFAVLNFAGGVQGEGCLAQAPTICEMLGIPYSGPRPQAAALIDDRLQQLQCLRTAKINVPVVLTYAEALQSLQCRDSRGVWVRGRFAADHSPKLVRDIHQFKLTYSQIHSRFGEVLIEKRPSGRSITAVVLHPERYIAGVNGVGDTSPRSSQGSRVLPLLERTRKRGEFRALEDLKIESRRVVEETVLRAAAAMGCRDCVRVDLHCTNAGAVTIAQVYSIDPLTRHGAAGEAAKLAGMSLAELAEELLGAVLSCDQFEAITPVTNAPEQARAHHYNFEQSKGG